MSLNLMPVTTSESVEVKDDQHPLRCTNCFGYVNPWFVFKDNGKRFTCNICRQVSDVPETSGLYETCYSPLDDRNLPIDFEKRPELSHPVYEFNVSSDYNAYPMRGEWKVFVIHATGPFLESGMACVAEWIRNRRATFLLARREVIRIMIAKQRKYRRSHIQKEHPTWEPDQVDEADKLEERYQIEFMLFIEIQIISQIEALMPQNLFSIVFLGSTTDFVTIPTGLDPKSGPCTSEITSFTIQGLNDHQNFGLSKQYHDVSGIPFLWNQFMIPVEKVSDLFLDRLVDLSSYKGWGTSDTLDHLDNAIGKALIHIGKFGREKTNYPHVFLIIRIDPKMKHHYSIQLSPSAQQKLSQASDKDPSLGEKFTQMLGIKSASAPKEGQPQESFQVKLSQTLSSAVESICTLDVFVLPPTSQGQDSLSADEVTMLSKLADHRTRIEYQTSGRTHIYQSESAFDIDNFQQELLGVMLTKEEGPRSAEFANATLVGRASFEVDLKAKIPYECEYNDELNIEYCHYYDE